MEDPKFAPGRLAMILGTAAFLAVLPLKLDLAGKELVPTVKMSQALASGSDDDGGDDDSGRDGDRDDDHDDDRGDDHGGDRDDDSGRDDSGDDSGDDDSNDDSGNDSSDDDGTPDQGSGDNGTSPNNPGSGDDRVTKVEVSARGIEVSYADGTKEEIENGRYERKNAAGRTVEERPATQADIDRLNALL